MGENTLIEWATHTFNPWVGCTKVHPGCKFCYAEELATTRLGRKWGPGAPRQPTNESLWKLPYRWAYRTAKLGIRQQVFCASLADILDAEAPKDAQERLWKVIRDTAALCTPRNKGDKPYAIPTNHWQEVAGLGPKGAWGLDWLLLTKRPERWEVIPEDIRPLIWLGTSISDQETAEIWIDRLSRATGFYLRFVSAEPLLGPVDLKRPKPGPDLGREGSKICQPWLIQSGIDWVIVGGESGRFARVCDLSWIRSIVEQCRDFQVPVFVKQLGKRVIETTSGPNFDFTDHTVSDRLHHKKGGDIAEFPADLRVREFPKGVMAA